MITKENFYKIFPFQEEESFKSQIYEKYLLAARNNQYSPIKFYLSPKYWVYLKDFCERENMPYLCEGFFEEAERKLFSFNYYPGDNVQGTVIAIKNKSKFRALYHKDYLGSILGLGIDRNTIGDIIVQNDVAYVAVLKDILPFIQNNLLTIGKNPCEIVPVDDFNKLPAAEFEEFNIIVTSRRLDNMVSALGSFSRGEAVKYIDRGLVLVNYLEAKEKSLMVKEGSTISIRGKGKFKVFNTVNNTKSGRSVIRINKFI
ncbi:YlmH/Sll1252 family protein [Alloiococcus sp. CFN-8]|uniref:YlmH/Sll1252 family protein n=1 Tax=Alloiococcus sp. CFN-8 TaxID=3416081 RepID=UPI003CEE6EB6